MFIKQNLIQLYMSVVKIIESYFLLDINNYTNKTHLHKTNSFKSLTSKLKLPKTSPPPLIIDNDSSSSDNNDIFPSLTKNEPQTNYKRPNKKRQQTLRPNVIRHFQLGNITPKNPTESEIAKIALILKDSLIKFDSSSHLIKLPQDKLLSLFLYSIKKKVRNTNDLLLIRYYLSIFPSLITTLRIKKNSLSSLDVLHKLSVFIQYEKYESNRIVCLNGEIGDKFYLIFDGKVAVFVPHSYIDKLTGIEYINHLYHLRYLKEYDLLKRTIEANKSTFLTAEIVALSSEVYNYGNIFKYNPSNENDYLQRIQPLKGITRICQYEDSYSYLTQHKYVNKHYDYSLSQRKGVSSKTNDPFSKRRLFTLWTYHKVCELTSGKSFGDIALSKEITNRTATILTLEPTIFGSLSKTVYQFCMKELQDKSRKLNVDHVYSHKLFDGCNKEYFQKNYFNLFKLNTIRRGEYLFKQGEYPKDLYFIYDGELGLETKMSINEITNIIHYIGIGNKKEFTEEEENAIKQMNIIMKHSLLEFFNIKQMFKVFIINNREIIGLDDYVINKKYFVSGKCLSESLNYYAIEFDLFLRMVNNENIIKKNFQRLLKSKKDFIVQRLKYLKKQKMLQYIKTRVSGNIESKRAQTEYICVKHNEQKEANENNYKYVNLLSYKAPPLKNVCSFNKTTILNNHSVTNSSMSLKFHSPNHQVKNMNNFKSLSITNKKRTIFNLNKFNRNTNLLPVFHTEHKEQKKDKNSSGTLSNCMKNIQNNNSISLSSQFMNSPKKIEKFSNEMLNNKLNINNTCCLKSDEFVREKVLNTILNTSNISQKWENNFGSYNTIDCLAMDDYGRHIEKTFEDNINANNQTKKIIRKGLYKQLRRRVLKKKLFLKS